MGSTGETDRKRRLSSPFAPGAAAVAPAKRPALPPCSDDKKLDFAVFKYRNQKLSEQLEVHKFEYCALEGKFDDLKQRQKAHNKTLDLVNKSWKHLVRDLEVTSVCKSGSQNTACSTDGARISQDKDFLSRLIGTGATEIQVAIWENMYPWYSGQLLMCCRMSCCHQMIHGMQLRRSLWLSFLHYPKMLLPSPHCDNTFWVKKLSSFMEQCTNFS